MRHVITEMDKLLIQQHSLNYKYKLLIVDNNKNVLDEVSGISTIGDYSIDSESDIRRTCSFTLLLDNDYRDTSVEKRLFSWIGYNFQLQIGIQSLRDDSYQWYDCGYYLITEANTTYNAADNSLSVNLSDWYSKLNGTRNGQIGGAPVILIPNEDEEGNAVTIKTAVENLVRSETDIVDYLVDDIGEFYGMSQNNADYMQYRENNPEWNKLPYDLEYSVGCTVGEILEEVRDLYPNNQMYFDIYGNFCFNMIPSCENDSITLDNSYIQSILLADDAENVAYDIESIKNVTEVFGQSYEVDRYASTCVIADDVCTLTLDSYEEYSRNEMVAFKPTTVNTAGMKFQINALDAIPLYYEYSEDTIEEGFMEADKVYVVQIKMSTDGYVAYYLGQYQPHALCVLVDNLDDTKYTKDYFATKYNCDKRNITLRVEKGSPFTVQKIGEVLDVKTGDEYDNILSDSVAIENAIYYNRKSSSINETITISTKMIPFLDTNIKVEYKKQQEEESNQYIVKSISNGTDSNTSTITMYRFYTLYYA